MLAVSERDIEPSGQERLGGRQRKEWEDLDSKRRDRGLAPLTSINSFPSLILTRLTKLWDGPRLCARLQQRRTQSGH